MHSEDEDQAAHSVPAAESAQAWAAPSPEPSERVTIDTPPVASGPYQSPVVAPGVIRPVRQDSNAAAERRTRSVRWIAGVGGLLVASIVAAAVFSASGPDQNADQPATAGGSGASTGAVGSAMRLPSGADGLVLLDTSQAHTLVARMRQYAGANSMYKNAVMGAYGKSANGDYTMALVIEPIASLSAADRDYFAAQSPLVAVDQMVGVARLTDVTMESPSQPDVAMSCGTFAITATSPVLTCLWEDSRDFGIGYFYSTYTTTSKADAARYTDALRVAAETS